MLNSVWAGSTIVALLSAAVAWADGPAGDRGTPGPMGPCLIVPALEGLPGGWIEAVQRREGDQKGPAAWLEALRPPKVSDYWVGLECYPADAALRAQLKLPEGQGLVVRDVAPDSPAAKAGLKQYDVLVKAGGKPLGTVAGLVEAVEAAKNKKLSLEVLRAGQRKTIDVAPAKRPEEARLARPTLPPAGAADLEALRKWYDQLKEGAGPPMQFRFFRPGTILPPGAPVQPPLPRDMKVVITRQGAKPAKIVVTKGDKKWEVTENQLDKLPKNIRPHVERMLGRIPTSEPGGPGIDVAPPGFVPVPDKQLKRQLDQMNRQIEELRKAVEQMQSRANRP